MARVGTRLHKAFCPAMDSLVKMATRDGPVPASISLSQLRDWVDREDAATTAEGFDWFVDALQYAAVCTPHSVPMGHAMQ